MTYLRAGLAQSQLFDAHLHKRERERVCVCVCVQYRREDFHSRASDPIWEAVSEPHEVKMGGLIACPSPDGSKMTI